MTTTTTTATTLTREIGYTELEAIIIRATGNRDIYVMVIDERRFARPASYTVARLQQVHA